MTNDNEVVELLKQVRWDLPAEVDQRVLRDASQALAAGQAHSAMPTSRRWVLRGAIAAALAIAVTVPLWIGSPGHSAAQVVQEIQQAGRAYKGWAHVRVEATGPVVAQGPRSVGVGMTHVNMADGTLIHDYEMIDEAGKERYRVIVWESPSTLRQMFYDSREKTVRITDLPRDRIDELRRQSDASVTMDEAMAVLEPAGIPLEKVKVERSKEGGLIRYDVKFPRGAKHPGPLSVWVSPDTKLIQKLSAEYRGDDKVVKTYTYGPPEFKEMRDLGVPADARIVDERRALKEER